MHYSRPRKSGIDGGVAPPADLLRVQRGIIYTIAAPFHWLSNDIILAQCTAVISRYVPRSKWSNKC